MRLPAVRAAMAKRSQLFLNDAGGVGLAEAEFIDENGGGPRRASTEAAKREGRQIIRATGGWDGETRRACRIAAAVWSPRVPDKAESPNSYMCQYMIHDDCFMYQLLIHCMCD